MKTTLDRRIEAALANWPAAVKEQQSSTDAVTELMSRLEQGDMGTTAPYIDDERIFSAPLGQEDNFRHNWSGIPNVSQNGDRLEFTNVRSASGGSETATEDRMSMTDRERERKSLQDLMEMAKSQPKSDRFVAAEAGHAKGEDSGLIRLASFFEDSSRAAASETVPVANSVPPPAVASAPPPPPSASLPSLPSVPSLPSTQPQGSGAPSSRGPASATLKSVAMANELADAIARENDRTSIPPVTPNSVAPPALAVESHRPAKKSSGAGILLLGVGALGGIAAAAAAVFVMLKPAPEVAKTEPKNEPVVMAPAKAPVQEQAAAPAPEADKIPELPAVVVEAPKGTAGLAAKPAGNGNAKVASNDAPKKEAPLAAPAPPPDNDPAHATGTLAEAMRQAAGPAVSSSQEDKKGPEYAAGSVPLKPSQGALTGAIGAALPSARACLGPDDPVSRATITFSSNGSVQSVSVNGGASGTAAEGCIKAALGKTKVSPFAESTYVTTVTVRH